MYKTGLTTHTYLGRCSQFQRTKLRLGLLNFCVPILLGFLGVPGWIQVPISTKKKWISWINVQENPETLLKYRCKAYPLVNVYITMKFHHAEWVYPSFQWSFSNMFYGYFDITRG